MRFDGCHAALETACQRCGAKLCLQHHEVHSFQHLGFQTPILEGARIEQRDCIEGSAGSLLNVEACSCGQLPELKQSWPLGKQSSLQVAASEAVKVLEDSKRIEERRGVGGRAGRDWYINRVCDRGEV